MTYKKSFAFLTIAALLFSGAVFTLGGFGQSGPESSPNLEEYGLVGFWNMEEGKGQTVYDRSGNGNNGTLGASTAVAKDDPVFASGYSSAGAGGTGLKFDGVDDYLSSNFQFSIFNFQSISQFLNFQTLATGKPIIGKWGNNQNAILLKTDDTSSDELKICAASSLTDNCANYGITTDADIAANAWYHTQIVYDGTQSTNANKLKLYLNGVQKTLSFTGTIPSTLQNSSGALEIGGDSDLAVYIKATIDEVRIYNRALSADEIRQHYNQKNPIIDLKMDEGSGSTAKDESFNNNDITLVNTPIWLSGKFGSALDLESSSSQYGYIADNASISLTKDLTISAWIKPESTTAATLFDIAGKWDGANESYLLSQYGDEIRMYIDSSSNYKTTDSGNLTAGNWYHIEGVYNATAQTVKIYINGIETAGTITGTIPSSISDDAGRFQIGAEDSTTTAASFYDGVIDEARVYSYARTQDEILADYNAGLAVRLGVPISSGDRNSEGLVGFWNMEEGKGQTVIDRSGNSNNGTLGGTSAVQKSDPVFTSGYSSAGAGGTASQFDGVDDYVSIGNPASLQITGSLSIEAWIKTSSTASQGILTKYNSATNANTPYQLAVISSKVFMQVDAGASCSANIDVNRYSSSNVNNGVWHHVVGVYNASAQTLNVYVDGSNNDGTLTGTPPASLQNCSDPVEIGAYNSNVGGSRFYYFNGSIDEVRIYNRALSADEIRQHYNQKKPIAEWKMDEGSGQKAYDSSFNHNDGWLGGTSAVEASDPTWTTGKESSALSFDGTDDYVSISDPGANSVLDITNDFTLEAWIKFDTMSSWNTIISKGITGGDFAYYFAIGASTNNSVDLQLGGLTPELKGLTALSSGQWYHLVATRNGSNAAVYINGKIDNTATISGSIRTNDIAINVGKYASGYLFDGLIDSVRIYNYARTQDKILADYNAGKAAHLGKDGQRDDGLVGYWNMEEGKGQTVYDRSGNGNNGTLGASTAVAKDDPVFASGYSSAGAGGTASQFDGVDDYVSIGNPASLQITGSLSIEAWIKTSSTASQGILTKYNSATNANTPYQLAVISSKVFMQVDAGASCSANIDVNRYSSSNVNNGVWHHVVGVYNASAQTLNVYVDGSNNDGTLTGTPPASLQNCSDPVEIGAYNSNVGGSRFYYFNGSIDEVRIYNRALSADEIRQHYNQKKPIIDLKMDEGSGSTAKDESFNNNDITLVNTPIWLSGKFGSALDLESSSSQYGYITDNASISLTKDLTISTWIKPESTTAATLFDITGKWDGANESYLLSQYGDEIRMYIDSSANYKTTDSANLVVSQWYHIESTYNAVAQTVNIYINGVLQTGTISGTIPASIGDDAGRFQIGAEDSTTTAASFYDGVIDEARVYSYARTQDEILADYNAGLAARLR